MLQVTEGRSGLRGETLSEHKVGAPLPQWEDLFARRVEDNVYYSPKYALALLQSFEKDSDVRFAVAWDQMSLVALLLGVTLGAFFLLVLVAGEQVMRLLYPGEAYEGHGLTLSILALATLVGALAILATNALASMERPRPLAKIAGVFAALNLVLVWWLIGEWGLLGAVIGVLAANLVGTLGRWPIFLASTRDDRNPAAIATQEQ